jgi:hypothetical protein
MKKLLSIVLIISTVCFNSVKAQKNISIDTTKWEIKAKSYSFESFKGKEAINIKSGSFKLKNTKFLNGTIEFDIVLKGNRAFPGVYFRMIDDKNGEHWYLRPHQSGNPDANQAAAIINGVTPWQLYFGKKYSFKYDYKYNDWTHVKLVVNDDKAQVFLDYSDKPNLSWNLFTETKWGDLVINLANRDAIHIANITVDKKANDLVDFKTINRKPIPKLIEKWEVSNAFKEEILDDSNQLQSKLENAKWMGHIEVEEGMAANISRKIQINRKNANTVFAKIEIISDKDQQKLFHFGYSDRVVAILNGSSIYKGNNSFRTRDYRYLGTIGLFDAAYLNLKKGKNTLIMAVSESFGGWLITGKFDNYDGLKIKY